VNWTNTVLGPVGSVRGSFDTPPSYSLFEIAEKQMLRLQNPLTLAAIACLALAGCNPDGRPPGAKPTKPVTVTVTHKGTPVDGATVSFLCDPPSYGRTDASGVAKMKTYVEGDGAIVGSHKATVIKSESVGGNTADVSSPQYDPNAPSPEIKHLIPVKYSQPDSGLTADVKESGPNEIKFELTD
jgi:hypothetical protein